MAAAGQLLRVAAYKCGEAIQCVFVSRASRFWSCPANIVEELLTVHGSATCEARKDMPYTAGRLPPPGDALRNFCRDDTAFPARAGLINCGCHLPIDIVLTEV